MDDTPIYLSEGAYIKVDRDVGWAYVNADGIRCEDGSHIEWRYR